MTIYTILSLVATVVIMLFVSWYLTKFLKHETTFHLLDSTILSIFAFFIISRIFGLIFFYQEIVDVGWNLLPIEQFNQEILLFESWPWIFLQFTDGRFLFLPGIAAFLIAEAIRSIVHRQRKQESAKVLFYQYALSIQFLALLPFFAAQLFNNYLGEAFTPAMPLFNIAVYIFLLIWIVIIAKNTTQVLLGMFAASLATIFYLSFAYNPTASISSSVFAVQILYSPIIIVLGIRIVKRINIWYIDRIKKKQLIRNHSENGNTQIHRRGN